MFSNTASTIVKSYSNKGSCQHVVYHKNVATGQHGQPPADVGDKGIIRYSVG